MKKNGGQKRAVIIGLLLILILSACPIDSDDSPAAAVTSVAVSPAPYHGIVFAGEKGTLNYLITVGGDNVFPIDLLGPDVVLGWVNNKDELEPVQGIEICGETPQSVVSGSPSPLRISVNRLNISSLSLTVSVRGIRSKPFILNVSTGGPAASVAVAPDASNPGSAFAGAPGIFNFRITVTGTGIFPIDLTGPNVVFKLLTAEGLADLPEGISVRPGSIPASGAPAALNVIVDRPDTAVYTIIVIVYGRPSSAFDLIVSRSELTGNVTITGSAELTQSLTANTAGLSEGGAFSYRWQRAPYPGADYLDITGAAAGSYAVQNIDAGHSLRVVVSRQGVSGAVVSDPSAPVPGVAVDIANLRALSQLPSSEVITAKVNGERLTSQDLYFGGRAITITLRANPGANLQPGSRGYLFKVGRGVTLVLEDITLQGMSGNNRALILIEDGGTLTMNSGARITGNTNTSPYTDEVNQGGAVYTAAGGVFNMNAGTIIGNQSAYGGGVVCQGTFNMNGGTITTNTATESGGGVFLYQSDFIMSGGTITNNSAVYGGSGVDVAIWSYFEMRGGTISSNRSVNGSGGGIRIYTDMEDEPSRFDLRAGTITGNSAYSGGGIANFPNSIFRQFGGTVSNNTAMAGGGVLNNDGEYTMTGGTIAGNSAIQGGGVNNQQGGFFIMSTGVIHGVDALPAPLRNSLLSSQYASGVSLESFGENRKGIPSLVYVLPLNDDHELLGYNGFSFGTHDLTLDARDASVSILSISNLPLQYSNKVGYLRAHIEKDDWYGIGPWLVPEEEGMDIGFLFPVTPRTLDFELDFHEIVITPWGASLGPLIATYSKTVSLDRGVNEMDFNDFEYVAKVLSITVEDFPSTHPYLDIYLLADFGSENYKIVGMVDGPITTAEITFFPSITMEPRIWDISLVAVEYQTGWPVAYYDATVELFEGDNTISFNDFVEFTGDGYIAPSMNMRPSKELFPVPQREQPSLSNRLTPSLNMTPAAKANLQFVEVLKKQTLTPTAARQTQFNNVRDPQNRRVFDHRMLRQEPKEVFK